MVHRFSKRKVKTIWGDVEMYICVEKNKNGEIENALYYLKKIGRRRIYRQSYPKPSYTGLVLFTYKKKENAQELCDYVNYQTGSKYKVQEVM